MSDNGKIHLPPDKYILDITCGARSMWFNKNHERVVYCDQRKEDHQFGEDGQKISINPDYICKWSNLPFEDNTFRLVVWDPPHMLNASEKSWMVKKYGTLKDDWEEEFHKGFAECMRVLKPQGILIFKWAECRIPFRKVIEVFGQQPLFGHTTAKSGRTFWATFMKEDDM